MTPEEQERIARLRSRLSEDRAKSLELVRQKNRDQLAVQKEQTELAKQRAKESATLELEALKTDLQPQQLQALHNHNVLERADTRQNNELELRHATDCEIDKMIAQAHIDKMLMKEEHKLKSESSLSPEEEALIKKILYED